MSIKEKILEKIKEADERIIGLKPFSDIHSREITWYNARVSVFKEVLAILEEQEKEPVKSAEEFLKEHFQFKDTVQIQEMPLMNYMAELLTKYASQFQPEQNKAVEFGEWLYDKFAFAQPNLTKSASDIGIKKVVSFEQLYSQFLKESKI